MKINKLWWQHGIIYQIYPRSFSDTNADGIGDLQGIIQHLDYLEDLGIDAIWLSPINPSPDVDFGYDVADYFDIDRKFGNLSDFDQLLSQAHRRNIHIILDLVLNHTSDQNSWFKESRKSKDNPYHDWYIWHDPSPKGGPPNNWQAIFGGTAWEYVPEIDQYYYHMFCKEQPDLNWRNDEVHKTMMNVFRFWLDLGVDGFRLDVFNMYFKHSKYPNNPVNRKGLRKFDRQEHVYDVSQPEMIPIVEEIRQILNQYDDRYVVGETFLASPEQAITYIGEGKLHAGFDYGFANSKWGADTFSSAIKKWDGLHCPNKWPNFFLNNHDSKRSATRYAKGEDDAKLKVLAAMHLTIKGTPFLYYGEEIGMRDIRLQRGQILDPVGKHYWPFNKGRDGCRSPMQWNENIFSGFSNVKPWLPVHPNYVQRNVKLQAFNPDSLLNFYKDIIQLRRDHPALYMGDITFFDDKKKEVLAYTRQSVDEQILVLLNFENKTVSFEIPGELRAHSWRVLFAQYLEPNKQIKDASISLAPYETVIFKMI